MLKLISAKINHGYQIAHMDSGLFTHWIIATGGYLKTDWQLGELFGEPDVAIKWGFSK